MSVLVKRDKVHRDVLPGAVWYWERLEEARGLVKGTGSSPTGVTIAHISFHIS
jgi:hypothetical protein